MEIALNRMKRLLKAVGAKRVSPAACEILAEHVERRAREILKLAKEIAKNAGRDTVTREDVRLAAK